MTARHPGCVLAIAFGLAGCSSTASSQPAPAAPPSHDVRSRIEGTWYLSRWTLRGKELEPPDIGGLVSYNAGVLIVHIFVAADGGTFLYCNGWYEFTDNDTVLKMGYDKCAKWRNGEQITVDFRDQWAVAGPHTASPMLPIKAEQGDLHLVYRGFDLRYRADGVLEYWNSGMFEGKKDNIKYFKKAVYGERLPSY